MVRWNPPTASMIWMHSAEVLVSHHSLAGASTSPASSTGTNPCCWPDTASATMRARSEDRSGQSSRAGPTPSRPAPVHGCHRHRCPARAARWPRPPPPASAGHRPAPFRLCVPASIPATRPIETASDQKGALTFRGLKRGVVSGPSLPPRASSPAVLPHCNQPQRKKRAATQNPATRLLPSNATRPRRTCSTAR